MILKGFYHISAWWPSWSCDLDYLLHVNSLFLYMINIDLALIGKAVSKKMYEYYANVYAYCHGVGQTSFGSFVRTINILSI